MDATNTQKFKEISGNTREGVKTTKPKKEEIEIKQKKPIETYKLLIFIFSPTPFLLFWFIWTKTQNAIYSVSGIFLGVTLMFLPWLIHLYIVYFQIKQIEAEYADFLTDFTEALSSGMSIIQAVNLLTSVNYGVLDKYLKRLQIWISWGIPFTEAWQRFSNFFERSKLVTQINKIILESFYIGGKIQTLMLSLSESTNALRQLEEDKVSSIKQQTMILYVIFGVFLVILVSIYKILLPVLFIQKIGSFSGSGIGGGAIGSLGGEGQESLSVDFFKQLFFVFLIIQSLSMGLMAGQMAGENVILGLKHILLMMSAGLIVFFVFIWPTQITFDVNLFPKRVSPGAQVTLIGYVSINNEPIRSATITVETPTGEIVLQTDNAGEFQTKFQAPNEKRQYIIKLSLKYQNQIDEVKRIDLIVV